MCGDPDDSLQSIPGTPMRIQIARQRSVKVFPAIVLLLLTLISAAASRLAAADPVLPSAVCQIVYPLDQHPTTEAYHYSFFGNAFFINEDGYLITAAHVLSSFRNGGQPHIIAGPSQGPRRLLEASPVAVDWEHDVAVLRVTPAPPKGENKIPYLRLSTEAPLPGKMVMTASLRSMDVENASSLEAPFDEISRGQVLDYQFHHEAGALDSEVMLVSQDVWPGESGSPLVSADSQGVVGIVVGKWLHPALIHSATGGNNHLTLSPGAALRIHYAISLLERYHIAWHAAAGVAEQNETAPQEEKGFTPPVPVSVVGTPYPPQALYGGEVLLDALIDATGKLTDLRLVSGDPPFVEPVLSAVRTWTFDPARLDGHAVEGRIGIVFQFPQSFLPPMTSKEREHKEPLADSDDRGALPVVTVEPDYPTSSIAEGSVALYDIADSDGHITSTSILRSVESLTNPTMAAVQQWQFVPGKQAGTATGSAVVVVVTFRRRTG
jgi:hypothetical protein